MCSAYQCHTRSCRRERIILLIGGIAVLLLLVTIAIKYDVSIVIRSSGAVSFERKEKKKYSKTHNDEEGGVSNYYKSIMLLHLHEEGHWEHQYSQSLHLSADATINKTYFPTEIEWMLQGTKNSTWFECRANDDGLIFVSRLGQQCGCGLPDFQPSRSRWISAGGTSTNTNGTTTTPYADEQIIDSPTLRLVLRLAKANMSLCFSGDSIDFQFYDALRNNINRQRRLLRNQINISISERYSIPVNYTNETGFPPKTGWMVMEKIEEMVVSIKSQRTHDDDDDDGETYTTRVRYFKMYGWSPWVTSFMDDCNVVVMNLGLHYRAHGEMIGFRFGGPKYTDDVMAAMTYMADFASATTSAGRDRIMVWRSVLPQHFNSTDGTYEEGLGCSLKPLRPSGMFGQQEIQNYNNVTDSIFLENCHLTTQEERTPPSCVKQHHEYDCTVNRTSMEYRTIYKFLLEQNCTARLARFQADHNEGSIVTGRILRWNIADLFDVPEWHSGKGDCSHFCYVPPLYEAAFERLDLLLPTLV